MLATTKWYHYLQGHHFIVKTDNQSLKYLLEQRLSTMLQQKWLAKLLGLDYEIVYKKGKENIIVNALSRLPEITSDAQLQAISSVHLNWLQEITKSYTQDELAQEVMTTLATGSANSDTW